MEKTLEQLELQARSERQALNKTINKIDKLKAAQGLPALEKMYLGKYFKTSNSYGDGKKWWIYTKVESIRFPNSFKGKTFQTTSDGIRTFDFDYDGYLSLLGKKISKAEYDRHLDMITHYINERFES